MNTNYSCLTNEDLLKGLKEKNLQIFGELYDRYAGALLGVINRIIEEDQQTEALNNVFIQAWYSIDKYDPSQGRLFTWLINLARKQAIAIQAKKGIIELQGNLSEESNISSICSPTENALIDMTYFKGFTAEQIAEKLDLPKETVSKLIRVAMLKLRKHF